MDVAGCYDPRMDDGWAWWPHSRTLQRCVGGRRMNPYRDASPRPRCTKCKMRPSRCLCVKSPADGAREPPNLDKTPGQQRLDVGDHAGSRVAYWMRWMRTTGIREGLTVPPEQHQSSQDKRRAYHGVDLPKKSKGAGNGARSEGKDDRVS